MDRAAYVSASFVGQGVISRYNSSLVPDGKWGRFTQRIYDGLQPSQRFAVDAALSAIGTSAKEVMSFRESERISGAVLVTSGDAREAVIKAAAEAGVDRQTALGYAAIESDMGRNTGGEARKRIFPRGYHGLMQMGATAWADAQRVDPSIGPFTVENAYNNLTNARAAMAFAKSNVRAARKWGWTGPINATALYMMHQQGAAGFVALWSRSTGQPNILPGRFKLDPNNLASNPPHDKQGVTTDPVRFLARWDEVVKAKTAAFA